MHCEITVVDRKKNDYIFASCIKSCVSNLMNVPYAKKSLPVLFNFIFFLKELKLFNFVKK